MFNKTAATSTNKDIFRSILSAMEEEYCLINEELSRVRRYTRRKEIRDVTTLLS